MILRGAGRADAGNGSIAGSKTDSVITVHRGNGRSGQGMSSLLDGIGIETEEAGGASSVDGEIPALTRRIAREDDVIAGLGVWVVGGGFLLVAVVVATVAIRVRLGGRELDEIEVVAAVVVVIVFFVLT